MKQTVKSLNLFDRELVAEIQKFHMQIRPEGFGITIPEYMQETGRSETATRRVFRKMLEKGYKQTKMVCNGKTMNVLHK